MDKWTETSSSPIDIHKQLKMMKIIYMIYDSIIKYDNSKLRDNSIPSSAIQTEVTGTLSGISQGSISHLHSPAGLCQGSAAGTSLTHWPLRYVAVIKKCNFQIVIQNNVSIRQHWFRWWLWAVVLQQVITLTIVDPDLCHHMASPDHSVLT